MKSEIANIKAMETGASLDPRHKIIANDISNDSRFFRWVNFFFYFVKRVFGNGPQGLQNYWSMHIPKLHNYSHIAQSLS